MKIVHLNTLQHGGAATAALRLHRALLSAGANSSFLSATGTENSDEQLYALDKTVPGANTISKKEERRKYLEAWKVRMRAKPVELFSFPYSRWKPEDHPLVQQADVVHLHWVAGMIDISRFFAAIRKPIVWTFHDEWAFRGGFHYEKYFNAQPFQGLSERLLKLKKAVYGDRKMHIVAPSRYMMEGAIQSSVFRAAEFHHVVNGFPTTIFNASVSRELRKKSFGIEDDEQMWFFSSPELNYFRKGADLLLTALSRNENLKVKLVMAGAREDHAIYSDNRIISCGLVTSETDMARMYAAADVTLHTSREDNLPNSIAESLLCGTPVFATPAGGVPEMISNGHNGWLSTSINVGHVTHDILRIRSMPDKRDEIASNAKAIYSSEIQVKEILKIYSAATGSID